MIVKLSTRSVVVLDADDCLRLSVLADDELDVEAALRHTGLGTVDPAGQALLDVDRLHDLAAAEASADDWESSWQTMVAYAATKGWVSADGRSLTAHVETEQHAP